MKKSIKTILTVAIVAAIIFLIALPKLELSSADSDGEGPQPGPADRSSRAIPVNAIILEPKVLDNRIKISGSVMANESVELRSEASGRVSRILFREGDNVKKGALLVSINDEELRAQLERLKFLQKLSEDIEGRQQRLLEKEAISQEEYDISLTELQTSSADIKVLEAQIAKSQIRAPFDGRIGLRQISEGSYLTPADPIASIFSVNPVKIEFSVPGKYSNNVKVGDEILFTVESGGDEHKGKVYALEPQVDPGTRTLRIRALSTNPQGLLRPGQFANIELKLSAVADALLVPTEAVIPELNGHKVFIKQNGKAESVKVSIGLRTEKEVEITSGLQPQDTVITTGILQLRPGAAVSVTKIN